MAYLQKQGSHWTIRFSFEEKKHRITVGADKAAAKAILKRVEATLLELNLGLRSLTDDIPLKDLLLGNDCRKSDQATLNDAIALYLKDCQLATSTIANYRIHHRHLIHFFGGQICLKDIKLNKYVSHRRKVVSDATIKKELITVNNLFKCVGLNNKDIPRLTGSKNKPFNSLLNSDDGRCVLLAKDEVNELRAIVRKNGSPLIADCVDLIAFTGIRRSEVCRLLPEHIDLEEKTLLITEKKRVHGQTTYRKLPIHLELLPIIERRLNNSPIFTASVNTLTAGLRKALKGTPFEKRGLGFHVLRHSAASRLLASGVPVPAVSAILGHATPQTTLSVYSHAFAEDVANAIDLL